MIKKLLVFLVGSFLYTPSFANIRLPKIFGDSMVLQRDRPIHIWGWADKSETVTVQFHDQKKTVRAGKDGKWSLALNAEPAGGPYAFTVSGKNKIVLNDVLVGDVWLCSGQSNMEWNVSSSNNAAHEIASANDALIRHFKVVNTISDTPQEDLLRPNSWKGATPANVGSFTAVGYFFARELRKQTGVPIGLINSTWGGTDVETWTSREAFENSVEFKNMITAVGTINLDSAAKARRKAMFEKIKTFQNTLPDAAALAQWPTPDFNDAGWPKMKLPALWEGGLLPDFDGVVWFRKTIEIVAAADAGKTAELRLAQIDDFDETYVNGVKVGATKNYKDARIYTIPAGVLKTGKNVIAVRVEDAGGGGGIYGDSASMKLTVGDTSIPLHGEWAFAIASVAGASSTSTNPNAFPTLLYNAMIHPLVPFTIKGALWYQGESNAGRAYQYRIAFPLMIQDWRKRWGYDFPFYFVQLASFNAGDGNSERGSSWAELREAQTMTLTLPHTGMAVTTDIGESSDIHPKNKQDVGMRLAAVALHEAYGKSNVFSGPQFLSMRKAIDDNKVQLSFTNIGSGLMAKDKYGYLKGFEVAGADRKFQYAKAFIQGDKVWVFADSVDAPVAVRYAWADDAGEANLYNREGFPAVPFRTDTWKGSTEGVTYRNVK